MGPTPRGKAGLSDPKRLRMAPSDDEKRGADILVLVAPVKGGLQGRVAADVAAAERVCGPCRAMRALPLDKLCALCAREGGVRLSGVVVAVARSSDRSSGRFAWRGARSQGTRWSL